MPPELHIFLPDPESSHETGRRLGLSLADQLERKLLKLPFLISLSGDLGAGKTTLCQGLGEALGIEEPGEIVSPTFTLANEYRGRWDIFHLDIYRLDSPDQFYEAGLDEYLQRPGLCLLEWPEKMPEGFWPDDRLALSLAFRDGGRVLSALPHPLSGQFFGWLLADGPFKTQSVRERG